jgi:hypothetical protein
VPITPKQATWLRRCGVLLESLENAPRDSVVYCDSNRIGTLEDVRIRWRLQGARIFLLAHAPGFRLHAQAISVRAVAEGLELTLRQAGTPPRRLCVVRPDEVPTSCRGFETVRQAVKSWLESRYPGARLVRWSAGVDRVHSISGSFLRITAQWRGRELILLGTDPAGPAPEAHAVLTQALLWLRLLRGDRGPAARIFLLVPAAIAGVVYHCARCADRNRLRAAVWEWCGPGDGMQLRRTPRPAPPVENRDFRWPVLGPFRWTPMLGRVLELAPEFIRRYPRFQDYDSLRLSGLEFARATGDERDRILFGVGNQQVELTGDNFGLLQALVEEILYFRRPDSPDTMHPYYRMQSERWLESLILDDAAGLFPELAPESVYSQIPVYLGPDPGRVDILAVDRKGTLVVMELKVSPNPELPVQALDYWGRVVRHNNRGDFQVRGYFAETRLNRHRPKIYLVSPVFSFHDSTEAICGFLDPAIDVWKISVNEDWRCGVRVLQRTRVRRGKE